MDGDRVDKIQVGEDPDQFVDLETFINDNHLRRVVYYPSGGPGLDPARHKGRYSVVVFKSGRVLKCHVSAISRSSYIVVSEANRGERRHEIRPHAIVAIYQAR